MATLDAPPLPLSSRLYVIAGCCIGMVALRRKHAGVQVTNRELGMAGEDAACAFLKRKGYRILDRNYRCPLGELDIIARRRDRVVFCEVKARSGGEIEEALGAVDAKRQERMARAASHYLAAGGRAAKGCRFDVIALLKYGDLWKIVHVEDAFEVGDL